jgi:hypothetical protein
MLSLKIVPVYQWTHREFTGVDPWVGGEPVTWSVVVYRMVGKSFVNATPALPQSVPSDSNRLPRPFVIGIFARAHNRYRVLPLALQELWKVGRVADQDLPRLLHRVEERLKSADYPPARLLLFLKVGALCFAGLTYLSCDGAFHGPQVNPNLLFTSAAMACLTSLCLGADFYWRARRGRLAARCLRILHDSVV